jgi:hypothetical protein
MRRLLIAILAAAALGAQVGTASATAPISFAFGRIGGNIEPFTVTIAADGSVSSTGPVRPLKSRVDSLGLARLGSIVTAQRFFTLPRSTRCPDTLPDFASSFVVVRKGSLSRRVLVRGDCNQRFDKTYAALTRAVGLNQAVPAARRP